MISYFPVSRHRKMTRLYIKRPCRLCGIVVGAAVSAYGAAKNADVVIVEAVVMTVGYGIVEFVGLKPVAVKSVGENGSGYLPSVSRIAVKKEYCLSFVVGGKEHIFILIV